MDKNPRAIGGMTTFHWAAGHGQFEVCNFIIQNVDDKNPPSNNGTTPLHMAARQGRFEVCKLIIENVDNKNPTNHAGMTPFHIARHNRKWKICRLIRSQFSWSEWIQFNFLLPHEMVLIGLFGLLGPIALVYKHYH